MSLIAAVTSALVFLSWQGEGVQAQGFGGGGSGLLPEFPIPQPETPLLTLDQDRMFAESAFGQRVAREIDQASSALAAENRKIEIELREEERLLTEQRPSLAPEEFRALADAFDEKAIGFRRTQDAKARALQRRDDLEREVFLRAALPVLTELVEELGAVAILDARAVLLASQSVDITDRATARIDAVLGDGAELSPEAPILPDEDLEGSIADEGAEPSEGLGATPAPQAD